MQLSLQSTRPAAQRRASRAQARVPVCQSSAQTAGVTRRELGGLAVLAGSLLLQGQGPGLALAAGSTPKAPVGTYFPAEPGLEGFVRYMPDSRKTPGIRAGVIKPDPDYYSFALPANWTEGLINNVLSGNFCMPRCDEPWVEAIFSDPKEGRCQLYVSPLFRLVSKAGAQLKDIGPPEAVVESIGNFITGTYLDPEDVSEARVGKLNDGREAYFYELNAGYAQNGNHCLATFTIKGNAAYLFICSANDKQWAEAEGKLRSMIQSFRA